ncbi:tape measure protein [Shewanella glacialimarina]|uniref:tape measure protein n=1 Tax=Shewanella glacialimarina TaxID=2590884 RepID=UPI001CF90EA6|nr:tape measure protein [Shewanella glacialimarina]UCX04996.1 tape measure protein [Shewanella glacialimarina]
MSFKDQVINLIIQGKDLFSSEAKKSEKALAELASESEILNARLKELEDLQAAANSIDGLTDSIIKGEKAYKDNSVALDKLVVQQKVAAKELKQLEAAQKAAEGSTNQLEQEYNQAQAALVKYETELQQARVEVAKLSSEQQQSATASKEQAAALTNAKTDLQQLTTEQTSAKNAATELATALDTQRRELLEVSTATDAASRNKAEYTLQVKTARTELNQLERSLNKNKTELDQNTASLNKAGISMDKLADASADLKQQQIAGEAALKGVNTKLERHNKLLNESQKQAGDFGGSVKSATASLVAMAGAYIGVDRLWESLKSILTAGDEAKAFGVQMSAMMGSIAGGEQATAWIKDFANNTATRLDTAKKAFASLKTFGIDPMNGSLQSMVDYNARLGGSQEKLEGIILAVGQAWAKQKLQGEEILQLVERGVPVWDLLEKVTGKNVTQLQKMSAAGELGRDVIKQLFDEMGKQANGQASKSLERLSGQVNLMSNKWTEFKTIIADSGAYQVAVDFIQSLNEKFDELNNSGQIKQAAQDISDFFTTMIRDGGASITATLENISAFARALNVISGSIRLLANTFTSMVATVGGVFTGLFAFLLEGWAKVIGFLGGDDLSKAFENQAAAIKAVSKAYFDQVEQDGKDAAAAWKQITGEIEQSASSAYKAAGDAATKSAKVQADAANKVANAQQNQGDATDEQTAKIKAFELAMSKAGITTISILREQAAAAKATYEQVKQGAADGVASTNELNQAFLKYAEAAIKAAAAGDQQVDASIRQQAANLGLVDNIDQLIGQYQRLKEVQGNVGNDAEENEVRVANANKGIGTTMENTMGVVVKSAEQAGTSLAGVAEFFTDFLRGVTAEVAELSKGAVAYFKSILYGQTLLIDSSSELDKTIETYRSLTGEINELQNQLAIAIDFTGISTFARKAEIAGKQAQAAYYGQRIELLKMVDALNAAEGGNIGLIRSAERAANSMNLMNDQDLGVLKSAIDSAKSSMDSLRDSAQSTLDTLQDELDGYLGRQDEIEKRRYQQELTEIKAQLTKAERTGDQALINQLREAEKTLSKVYAFRTAEIKAQQESDKQRAITDTQNLKQQTTPQKTVQAPAPQTSSSQTTVAPSSSDTVVLQLQVGNRTFDAQTKRSIVNELVAEIKRLQSVGG